jgi:hypothetical protein
MDSSVSGYVEPIATVLSQDTSPPKHLQTDIKKCKTNRLNNMSIETTVN